jgi:tRNA A-37 threonylcarbamoyl transferase component Bud32
VSLDVARADSRARVTPREPQVVFAPGAPGGSLTVHPRYADLFARLGLNTAAAVLDLPGEVVSGHPDRHVVRVGLPGVGSAFYLKRQHVVGWREKARNWRGGFGWVSRCEREASVLRQLESAHLPGPRWAAFGAHGGRAFLLIEAVPGASDLRDVLIGTALSDAARRRLAANIGTALADVHAAGFTTPDLTAKHVFVNPETLAVTLIDWQSTAPAAVGDAARAGALGALHASLAGGLASRADRARVLRAYGHAPGASDVLRAAARHATRRSVRDQLRCVPQPQRLVWLAGEAVCVVPEVAAEWPRPAVAPPFYGFGPNGVSRVSFAGRDTVLVRGRGTAPLGRLRAWLRATPWRSPGVTIGRVLFHLARYGVPAPQLLAFGQRVTGAAGAEWFALYDAPPGEPVRRWRRTAPPAARRAVFEAASECLRALHAADCILTDVRAAFAVDGVRVMVADPAAVRIVSRVTPAARRRDVRRVARLLGTE